ncbi:MULTISPECIES: LCP family protein [Nocardiopsis]|uniref:Transcriptional regulator n=1 Tax=Nocardiopsis sinuspersici TaxID=501010 RepID=A0A1V3C6W8_9ACTN|nr:MULTISPECIES: LCP family protein [Nocardiopsis]OOC56276.1 transcriptional regulator [Nocardiopsis sinuspersici]
MPADENSADPGADHTPDETPEKGSDPGDTGSDQAGSDRAGDTGRDHRDGSGGTVSGPPENQSGNENGDGEDARDTASSEGSDDGEDAQDAKPSKDSGGGEDAQDTEPSKDSGDGDEGEGDATAAAAPVRGRRRRVRRILMWTAVGLALVLTAGVATAYGYYHSLRSGMTQHDIDSALQEEDRPERINDAVNILFMGTDGYEEGTTAYTQEFEGERSDAIMLAHVSPDNRVSVISFPRDSLVNLPQCEPYGETEGTQAYFGMINAAMYHGGPPCVVRTVESLTDIRIDHFVHLSFMSFRDVVNAIGGVDICIPEPMRDSRSGLDLQAGRQTLDGDEALSFVRARYEIGNGSDIGRIDRQQMFLAALADQVTSNEVLSSPTKLNGILRAVARNSATDQKLTLDRMLSLAVTLSGVDLTDIQFHTVPWYQAPFDPNRVMWHEEKADALFTAVREDRPVSGLAADDAAAPQEPPGTSPSPVDVSSAHASPPPEASESARPDHGQGRDATSDPCSDGLGYGTGEEAE